jgi:GGDEF domain-containing protein
VENLEQYNRQMGWEQGNLLMEKFAAELQLRYPDTLLFRAYGRDFVVISAEHFEMEGEALVFLSLRETGVTVTVSHVDLRGDATYYLAKLEHLEFIRDLEGYR